MGFQVIIAGGRDFADYGLLQAKCDQFFREKRPTYDLQNWIAGMKSLPPAQSLPDFCAILGLDHLPQSEEEIKKAFREMAMVNHPDKGGSDVFMRALLAAKQEAEEWLRQRQ